MLCFLAALCILLLGCSPRDKERTGVEAGNTKVAGVLIQEDGSPLARVAIALTEQGQSPLSKIQIAVMTEIIALDTTDAQGRFEFYVPQGIYVLSWADTAGWVDLTEIDVDQSKPLDLGTVDISEPAALSSQTLSAPSLSSSSSYSTYSSALAPVTDTLLDTRDGQVYATVEIDSVLWMAENLNYSGDDAVGGRTFQLGWCYGQDSTVHTDNAACLEQGRFYNWTQAMNIDVSYQNTFFAGSDVNVQGICPMGWHLPSTTEWTALQEFVGGMLVAGTALKATGTLWLGHSGVDAYGFRALPTGYLDHADWVSAGEIANFWTATETLSQSAAESFQIGNGVDELIQNDTPKYEGHTIRCVGNVRIESDH